MKRGEYYMGKSGPECLIELEQLKWVQLSNERWGENLEKGRMCSRGGSYTDSGCG